VATLRTAIHLLLTYLHTYPLEAPRGPPGVRVPQVENPCSSRRP